jgi:hypothetical protein
MPSLDTPCMYHTVLNPEKLYSKSLLPSRKGIVDPTFITVCITVNASLVLCHNDLVGSSSRRYRIVECITCTTRPARHFPQTRINAVNIHAPVSALLFVSPPPALIRTSNPLPVISIRLSSPHPMRKRPGRTLHPRRDVVVHCNLIRESTIAVTPVAVASHADPRICDCGHRQPC